MTPSISEADFTVLVTRAGLPLTSAQSHDIYEIYGLIEAIQARVHAPLPREAEPAAIFTPHAGA